MKMGIKGEINAQKIAMTTTCTELLPEEPQMHLIWQEILASKLRPTKELSYNLDEMTVDSAFLRFKLVN